MAKKKADRKFPTKERKREVIICVIDKMLEGLERKFGPKCYKGIIQRGMYYFSLYIGNAEIPLNFEEVENARGAVDLGNVLLDVCSIQIAAERMWREL